MSSQGFSFPPPPPPPPPTTQQPVYSRAQNGWSGRSAGGRGRGRGHGNRGRGGGHHHINSVGPPHSSPPSYNYAPGSYGYPAPPASATSYMPPAPYPHTQSNFPHARNPPTYQSPQPFSQSPDSAPFHPLPGYNNPTNFPPSTSYSQPATPSYPPGLSTHQHATPTGPPMMMASAPWGADVQPAGPFGGAAPSHARNSWSSYSHGNHGPKPRHNNKRDHTTAFSKPQSSVPRTPAPPAVPSFGNPLPSKPPPPADATRKPKKRKRKQNQLGLTPKTEEHESSEEEEDVDDESKLVRAGSGAAPLQVTYKGQTATLQSTSDIAAWIAERKKKFPTAARIAEKKKAADEAKVAREAARQEKETAKSKSTAQPQAQPKDREPKAGERSTDPALDAAMKAQRKADKIRRNLNREQKRFARAEAAAEAARLKVEALRKQAEGLGGDGPQQDGVGTTSSQDALSDSAVRAEQADEMPVKLEGIPDETVVPTVAANGIAESSDSAMKDEHADETPVKLEGIPDEIVVPTAAVDGTADPLIGGMDLSSEASHSSDWTSSSGSDSGSDSDGEDDSAPEEVSSRRQGPERVAPPPREGKKQLCRHFARSGHCNRGDKCKFSHEVSEHGPKNKSQAEKKGRKGLFHALLERQKEDEDRRAMEVICWLGQHGMLEPTSSSMPNGGPRSDTPA